MPQTPTTPTFSDRDLLNLDIYLATIIAATLKRYRALSDGSHPDTMTASEFTNLLERMQSAFERVATSDADIGTYDSETRDAIRAFGEHFPTLWL